MSLRHHCCTGGRHQTHASLKSTFHDASCLEMFTLWLVHICCSVLLLLFLTKIFEKEYVLLNNAAAAARKYEQNTTNTTELTEEII